MERKFKSPTRIIIFFFLIVFNLKAQEKSDKIYSEKDFIKKVSEETQKKVDQIKNKSVTDLTKELIEKEEKMKIRELELAQKEDQIKVNALELEKKVKAFEEQQLKILGCAQKNEDDAKARIVSQVEVISNMQPAKAAQVLTVQDPDIAVRILRELEPKKASKIFNFMEKEVSARLQKQYLDMKK
jgi:flagellar motility protein MotE (MotC chaperone)